MFDSTLVSMICVHAQSCLTLCNPMDHSLPGSSFPWNFPDKNTAVGCHFLLQEILPTQRSNLHLLHFLHWQADSLPLCYLEKQYNKNTHIKEQIFIFKFLKQNLKIILFSKTFLKCLLECGLQKLRHCKSRANGV